MLSDVSLHKFIVNYNILQKPTEQISSYLKTHPTLCKAVLLANHLFRAFAMSALCLAMPFSASVNVATCFVGSVIYRLTVETNCAYKFALPAFAGSIAIPMATPALSDLISGIAFCSLKDFALACTSLLPLAAYLTYIALTVGYDVDQRSR